MPNDSHALEVFKELEIRFRHPPIGKKYTRKDRDLYILVQRDLFELAQAIAQTHAPNEAMRVLLARKLVVEALAHNSGSATLEPKRMRRPIRWCEYLLTPELDGNLALAGTHVPRALALELTEAHRAQISAIRKVVGI